MNPTISTTPRLTIGNKRTESSLTTPTMYQETLDSLLAAQEHRIHLSAIWEMTPSGLRLRWVKK